MTTVIPGEQIIRPVRKTGYVFHSVKTPFIPFHFVSSSWSPGGAWDTYANGGDQNDPMVFYKYVFDGNTFYLTNKTICTDGLSGHFQIFARDLAPTTSTLGIQCALFIAEDNDIDKFVPLMTRKDGTAYTQPFYLIDSAKKLSGLYSGCQMNSLSTNDLASHLVQPWIAGGRFWKLGFLDDSSTCDLGSIEELLIYAK